MYGCRHSVLTGAIQLAADSSFSGGFGAPLTCIRTLFNCFAPVVISEAACPLASNIRQPSFAVYRLADTFRFATSIVIDCYELPVADLQRRLTEEIDVVQRVTMHFPREDQLEILLDLPHLQSITVPPVSQITRMMPWGTVTCAPLVRLFQQTTSRSLRRSIGWSVAQRGNPFFDPELFAPLMLDALLGAETTEEFYDLLFFATRTGALSREHEIDQFVAVLSDYKDNFAASTQHSAPLGVHVAGVAAILHELYLVPFDFEPFFDFVWNKYYETGLIDELVASRERVREEDEEPFEAPFELTATAQVVKRLFEGMMLDAADASRGDACIKTFFDRHSGVNLFVSDFFFGRAAF